MYIPRSLALGNDPVLNTMYLLRVFGCCDNAPDGRDATGVAIKKTTVRQRRSSLRSLLPCALFTRPASARPSFSLIRFPSFLRWSPFLRISPFRPFGPGDLGHERSFFCTHGLYPRLASEREEADKTSFFPGTPATHRRYASSSCPQSSSSLPAWTCSTRYT